MKLSRASVGLAVRAARGAAQLTLNDLAGMAGMTVTSLSRSENGQRDLEFSEAVAIAAALRIDVEKLVDLAENFERCDVAQLSKDKSDLKRELDALQREAIEAAIEVLANP